MTDAPLMAATVVAAARCCIGAPFRPQGRSIALGLDCVGLALIAFDAGARSLPPVPAYALAGDNSDMAARLDDFGLRRVPVAAPGDLLVLAPAAPQRHLAIVTPAGVVHAHAGLGRVVEGPIDPAWVVEAIWRLAGGQ